MVQPSNANADTNPSDLPTGAGPRESFVGDIIQRGGEELRVDKVPTRFTTRLHQPGGLEAVQAALSPVAVRPVAAGQLVEWQVNTAELEDTLNRARQHPDVAFASHVYCLVDSPQTWVYLTDEMTVQGDDSVDRATLEARMAPLGLALERPLTGVANAFVVRVTATATENPIKLANRLLRLPGVMLAEPNLVMAIEGQYRPTDDRYPQQWHLFHQGGSQLAAGSHIQVEDAWNITRGSRSVVIAVADDGFDLEHTDLQGMGKLVNPIDLKDRDAVPLPMQSHENHGTAVAGVAIGEENGSGIVGVAPGCAFLPIRTTGFIDDTSIEQLFGEAVNRGAAVIVCSWSPASNYFPLTLRQTNAITQAATTGRNGKGCVILFSAGNANRPVSGTINEAQWPRNALSGPTKWLNGFTVHPDVITVSASTSLNTKAAYSNWGPHIALCAPSNNAPPTMALPQVGTVATGPEVRQTLPGRGVVTSDRTGGAGYDPSAYTQSFGGTSSACPVVAGVVGLMLSVNPNLTAQEVREILQTTADKIVDPAPDPQLGLKYGTYDGRGHSQWFGYGKVNALAAVQAAQARAWSQRRVRQILSQQNRTALVIPDNQPTGIDSAIVIAQNGTVTDLQVQVSLQHEFLGDISLTLIAPSGQTVLLQGRTLGRQTSLRQTYNLQTAPALVAMLGQPALGAWKLRIVDHAPAAMGRLLEWRLSLGLG
ncbi:peptidase S8 [Leptolyngbya sp. BL0902]|uniref:S8 family serine peptidase n=1 Tax=Leptolyngbya sp. BL0902 TaxID=1115757 RepID=UPI0018E762AD|nr:S8 family serine peptidase [Leptolyngbya sp. BL0902]QQE66021.1 peptidase S8 [Leptolyngbya sp. BL0902]